MSMPIQSRFVDYVEIVDEIFLTERATERKLGELTIS